MQTKDNLPDNDTDSGAVVAFFRGRVGFRAHRSRGLTVRLGHERIQACQTVAAAADTRKVSARSSEFKHFSTFILHQFTM